MNKKIEVLKLAHAHQLEMLEKGIVSGIEYHEIGDGDDDFEYEVVYKNVHPDGDTQCTFDIESL